IQKLKEVEVLISQGVNPPDASRQAGISIRTFYRWRKDYGRMRVDQAKRLIDLEKENLRLKHLMADKRFDTQILKETLS
ncbi:MAG: transposase, partial [Candidatus Marinimicrobia bacterium]|nr:transposase [Candidatus Neomarinimicrobiota bacterium]